MMSVGTGEHHSISVNPDNNLSKDIEHTMHPIRMDNNAFPTENSIADHNMSKTSAYSPRGPKGIKVTIPGNELGETSLRMSTLNTGSSFQNTNQKF